MRHSTLRLLFVTTALAGAAACSSPSTNGPNGVGSTPCNTGLIAGDLVITEVLANPAHADSGNEWFEIYNTLDKPVTLTGVQVIASKPDDTAPKVHVIAGLTVQPGSYVAMGDILESARPAWMGYSYGTDLGNLPSSGALTIRCGSKLIDKVIWDTATEARSRGFDGTASPDAIGNDNVMKWCDATTQFNTDFKGTPGMPNDKCEVVTNLPKGQCVDPVTMKPRAWVIADSGQLVVSEVMGNPLGTETDQEWIEITATASVDLIGVTIGKDADPTTLKPIFDPKKTDCHPLAAGERLVLVRNVDPMLNGGIAAGPLVIAPFTSFTVSNSSVSVFSVGTDKALLGIGNSMPSDKALVDTVMVPAAAKSGVSWALDPMRIDAMKNDDARNWCDGSKDYGAGGKGTPGTANDSCNIVDPGTCIEGGMPRAKVEPKAGDIIVNEIMPDPSKAADAMGEWFELKVTRDLDLNGVSFSVSGGAAQVLPEGPCLRVTAGSYVVFAHETDPMLNGGLPMLAPWQKFNGGLVNGGGTLAVAYGMTPLDTYTWMSAAAGKAVSRDPVDALKWCNVGDMKYQFNGVDYGTPGMENPACP